MKRLFEPFLRPSTKHENFDPYFQWLQIPVEQQPPDLYQLLGLPLFASEQNEISRAASQQKAKIKQHAEKQHSELAEKFLSKIDDAVEVLSDPKQREEYNAKLRLLEAPRALPPSANQTEPQESSNHGLAQDLLDAVIGENKGLKEKSTELIQLSLAYQNELQEKEQAIRKLKNVIDSLQSGNDELSSQNKLLEGNRAKNDVEFQEKIDNLSIKVSELKSSIKESEKVKLDLKKEVEQIKVEKKKIRDKAAKYRAQLETIKAEKIGAEQEVARLQNESKSRASDNNDLVSQIGRLREELNARNLEFEKTLTSVKTNDQAVLAKLQERDNRIKDLQCSLDEIKNQVKSSIKANSDSDLVEEARPTETNPAKAAKQLFEHNKKERPNPGIRPLTPQSITLSSQSSLVDAIDENSGLSSLPSGSMGAGEEQTLLRFRVRDRKTNRIYFENVVEFGQEFCIGRVLDFCSDKTGVAPYVKDKQLSGRHFKFVAHETGILFTDVGSTNGTSVGNENLKDGSKTMHFDTFQDGVLTVRAGELMRYEFEIEFSEPIPVETPLATSPKNESNRLSVEEKPEEQLVELDDQAPKKAPSSLVDPEFNFDIDDSRASSRSENSKDSIDFG